MKQKHGEMRLTPSVSLPLCACVYGRMSPGLSYRAPLLGLHCKLTQACILISKEGTLFLLLTTSF